MDQTKPQTLPHSAFYKLGEEDKEVFMSFALLNRLTFLVGDITNIPLVHLNPEMREAILGELLAERTKSGKVVKPAQLDELEISISDIETLLDWAAEHITDFSLGAIEKAKALQARHQGRLDTLKSSLDGQDNKA